MSRKPVLQIGDHIYLTRVLAKGGMQTHVTYCVIFVQWLHLISIYVALSFLVANTGTLDVKNEALTVQRW